VIRRCDETHPAFALVDTIPLGSLFYFGDDEV